MEWNLARNLPRDRAPARNVKLPTLSRDLILQSIQKSVEGSQEVERLKAFKEGVLMYNQNRRSAFKE